jgi:3,4-dihydroxy 2-butanone 4-phosphate synthase/GTP cyclohydrolase II
MSSISVEEAVEEFKKGNPLIILDEENRENEGDLVMPAEKISPQDVNLFITLGRGLLCAPVSASIAQKLNFHPMLKNKEREKETAESCNFAISVDCKEGFTTGISCQERYNTITKICDDNARPGDFIRPGHMFPLIGKKGGALERAGHTETTLELCKLSGMKEVGMICEILNPDGSMARLNDLQKIAKKHNIKLFTVKTLKNYLKKNVI